MWTKEQEKEYMKAYYQAHKEQVKAWKEAHKEQVKTKQKAWKEAHKDYQKAWIASHKKQWKDYQKDYQKAWRASHKEQCRNYQKAWRAANKDYMNDYHNADLNSLGQTKHNIRVKSNNYLSKYGHKIAGYEIHHCCTYDEPYKFIYCSKEMHKMIHSYLRQHNIDADSDHYQFIKHLLDDSVVKYNIE